MAGGGCAWQVTCVVGAFVCNGKGVDSMCGGGSLQGACEVGRGYAWWGVHGGGMCGRGMHGGGMCDRGHGWQGCM